MVCQNPKSQSFCFSGLIIFLFLASTSSQLLGQMLYVGNFGDDTISQYVIDQQSGLLTEILPRVASTGSPSSVAIHPSKLYAYVTNLGNAALGVNGPSLAQFSIDPGTGALTLVSSVQLTPGSSPQEVAIDPTGNYALVAHQGGNYVSVFSIDPSTGNLTQVTGSPFATPKGPSSLVVHPNGQFVYVSATGAGQIAAFGLDSTGTLTPLGGSPFAARNGLFWMTMDPAGQFLFAVERQDGAVLVYTVDPTTGALTQVGSPVPVGPGVSGVAVDPGGKFLYVSTSGNGGVTVFSIDPTGVLTQAGSYGAINGSFAAILDPSGQFLYVPGQSANAIAGLAIDPSSGALTPLPQQFFPAGAQPERGATVLLSPPILPPIGVSSISNYHSHAPQGMPNSGIAQGSKIVIAGQNIGPAAGASSNFPLQSNLGGTSIQIQSGDVTTQALMVYATNNFVSAVVPSGTPLGAATVTVNYNGQTSAPLPITIVATSVGLRALNDNGVGPAKGWSLPPDTTLTPDPSLLQTPIFLNQTATPGQLVVLQATGLGASDLDETQDLNEALSVPANVIVGSEIVPVVYELRVSQGSDYIVFQLPDDVLQGCYVPVAVQAGGYTSNFVNISVSGTGGSCSDANGLSSSDIDAAQQAGQINMGTVVLSHIDLGSYGVSDKADAIFVNYGFDALKQAYSVGNNGAGLRAGSVMPPLGSCNVLPGAPTDQANWLHSLGGDQTPVQYLNEGPALNLNGPMGAVQLPAPDYSFSPDGNAITPGDYTVDNGTGTAAFGPFQAGLTVPAMLAWTNQASFSSIDRTQDLTVTWTGGAPDTEFALIVGLAGSNQATSGFICAGDIAAGQFTVPAWVLSNLPASDMFMSGDQAMPGGLLGVGSASFTNTGRFNAPGLDFALFTYEQATVSVIPYQ